MKKRILCLLMLCLLIINGFTLCGAESESESSDILAFRPVDCGVQALKLYDYPFMGLSFTLSDAMLEKLDSREAFAFTDENYTDENTIAYALMRFSATTEAQRTQEVMSVDIFSWEAALEKIGAIGVYDRESYANIDALTGCDSHRKIGESIGGEYEYYLSLNSSCDAALTAELGAAEIFIDEMHDLNFEMGYSAFSTDRIEGVDTVGEFSTTDVFGNEYTQAIFADYDLTLVNVFVTWCSPCVNEMPELEKLRAHYEAQGIRLGVVGMVMDIETESGRDEGALELAQTLHERSGAQFPFLIPDSGNLNQRLIGIESYPESFFVDSNGNIVGETYIGTNDLETWQSIVDAELERMNGQ